MGGRACARSLACLAFSVLTLLAAALPDEPRRILAFYDSSRDPAENQTLTYECAEVVFDHLGLTLDYRDLHAPLPRHEEMAGYRGVFVWLVDAHMPSPEDFCRWLQEETRRGRYVVFWGDLGGLYSEQGQIVDTEVLTALYAAWGLDYDSLSLASVYDASLVQFEAPWFGFERPFALGVTEYSQLVPRPGAEVSTLLSLRLRQMDLPPSSQVALHPFGGYAMQRQVLYQGPDYRRQWLLDPFRFLRAAFRWQDAPCPDATTLNGCRLFYSHIDGDGSISMCEADNKRLAVEMMHSEILSRYQLPVTVGVVEGEIATAERHPWVHSQQRVIEALRRIFRLDNVEAGSHGYTHPMHWTEALTGLQVPAFSHAPATPQEIAHVEATNYRGVFLFNVPREQWERREIVGSIDYIRRTLLPPGKECLLFQWTGNCVPDQSALALVQQRGLLSINGGDPRCDPLWPSYTALRPVVRHAGPYVQVLTSGANENIYTEEWSRNFGGFVNVIETFERSGRPRRMKPVNVYYHFYSAEKVASLRALRQVYDYCLKQDLAPLFTTEFVRLALNSREIRLQRQGDTWAWSESRQCRTLRWDDPARLPDLARSSGVLGYYVDPELKCLYVHLDDSGAGRVVLREGAVPDRPYLQRATGYVNQWRPVAGSLAFEYRGNGPGWIELAGLLPNREYRGTVAGVPQQWSTDGAGGLRLAIRGGRFVKQTEVKVILP